MPVIKEYCCCAVPLMNAGIIAALLSNVILGMTAGTLAFAAPSIVGASVPSFAPIIFGLLCYVAAVTQGLGLFAVLKERSVLFKRFTMLHSLITTAAFAVAAAFIIISATKHSTSQSACEKTFNNFNANATTTDGISTDTGEEGSILCNIFTWVTVGVMGGLWVILGIFEVYIYFVISGYGWSQRDDHAKYFALYSVNDLSGGDAMMMNERGGAGGDVWNSRMSTDSLDNYGTGRKGPHSRSNSGATMPDNGQYNDVPYANEAYPQQPVYRQNTQRSQATRQASGDNAYLSHPSAAYTNEPGPTPLYNDPYYINSQNYGGTPERPPPSQSHPAEGSFRRKTPRNAPTTSSQRRRTGSSGYLD
ncbi:hypothetical protein SISSUDRAFT_500130 [Sistotremastrum suecicum HHB10207 ss-3]|uniref:MARVEL domain-containing protein n=1 Tax=Sistotremastrum suecicum HHB10207 ss-3 TaxID=1314776 RepID=A0A166IJF6_9AGAM|nr:hypothetical protein SISSUDRAFT_500130 [Sistotremastrum suecicum HHB10207 ss-3]